MAEVLSTATVMHGAVHRLIFSENILSEKRITKKVFEYPHEHDYKWKKESDYGKINSKDRIHAGCGQI